MTYLVMVIMRICWKTEVTIWLNRRSQEHFPPAANTTGTEYHVGETEAKCEPNTNCE